MPEPVVGAAIATLETLVGRPPEIPMAAALLFAGYALAFAGVGTRFVLRRDIA